MIDKTTPAEVQTTMVETTTQIGKGL